MEEHWADIPNFARYQISSYGQVWNRVFERFMKPSIMTTGQLKVSLIDDQEVRRSLSVAVLVAQAFVDPPEPRCREVILLDGDLTNVAAYNLRWRTLRQAYLYARQMRTQPKVPWINLPIRNQVTGAVYKNVVECGITEGLLFDEIWKSTYKGVHDREMDNYKGTPVYPYGHTYEIIPYSERV